MGNNNCRTISLLEEDYMVSSANISRRLSMEKDNRQIRMDNELRDAHLPYQLHNALMEHIRNLAYLPSSLM